MVINLATIDFCPANGGGEAVIRPLDVTENGTYRAPSGVDGYSPVRVNVSGGGSITPEEKAALDTLVNSSDGTLYTETFKRYIQGNVILQNSVYEGSANSVFWDDLYVVDGNDLYKLNRESYQFDIVNHFDGMWGGPTFWGDKSGRFYWNGYELDLENGTIGQDQITMTDLYKYSSLQNILYGEYGVWIIAYTAYKFNESSQEFEEMTLNNTFGQSGPNVFINMFKYDGHILGVYNSLTFEVTEYEDHIDVADVTGDYFNMPSFSVDGENFKSTKDGDLYYISGYSVYIYDKTSGVWVEVVDKRISYPIYGASTLVSDNMLFSFYSGNVYYMNLGPEFKNTFWTKISNVAVDLISDQKIRGQKRFLDPIQIPNIQVDYVSSQNNITINAGGKNIQNIGNNIVFLNFNGTETIVKNGTKHIATVDQTFVNSTYVPYGTDGDNIGYLSGSSEIYYNFNTYTNRMFKKVGSDWCEFDGTSTLIPVSFAISFGGDVVYNSPTMTIVILWDNVSAYNTYMWDDANTEWDLICSSEYVDGNSIWFDGDNFRSGNEYKLEETGGVWSWVSDPLVNNIWDYNLKFGYKDGNVYVYNNNDWHLYKYDKLNCRLDKIGFVNSGRLWSYFNELFMTLSSGETFIIDLSKVDPQDPDENLLGDSLFNGNSYGFIGARDRLWYYNTNNQICSSYQYIYEVPEVPGSDGTYTLKAVRDGDQITYGWVLDV